MLYIVPAGTLFELPAKMSMFVLWDSLVRLCSVVCIVVLGCMPPVPVLVHKCPLK